VDGKGRPQKLILEVKLTAKKGMVAEFMDFQKEVLARMPDAQGGVVNHAYKYVHLLNAIGNKRNKVF